MLETVEAVNSRFKKSDPKPAFCSACLQGAHAELDFYDLDAAFDSGAFIDPDSLRYVKGSDDLHLCGDCARSLTEVAGFSAQLHGRQTREIKRLRVEVEHWRDTVRRLKDELNIQIEAGIGSPA